MKIKTKLTLGVGLLFALIILLGLVGAIWVNRLKADTENILVANYNTLEYARDMLSALEEKKPESIQIFETNLEKQEKNITEFGEKEATQDLRMYFEKYKLHTQDTLIHTDIRKVLFLIMDMNMGAIQRKSELAKEAATSATVWIAVTATLCFMIAFILLVNLPAYIANPIKELTQSIKQIADEKYSERVHFESHDEFGDLAASFNTMAKKLEEYNNSNLANLMMEKKRIETLINNMHDPVIGLDKAMKIIFINEEGGKIIGLERRELVGNFAKDIAIHNDLMRLLIRDLFITGNETEKNNGKPIKAYANGKESYFEKETLDISIIPTGEKNATLIGYVIILRNVTQYKELDFAKTNFIATVSHEFKTPIASIKMSLQLLQNNQIGQLNPEQQNLVESIKEDAGRLLKITSELLNMTQVESGNIQLSVMAADPKEILLHAIDTVKTQADNKHINLKVNIPENLPRVRADSEKTAWVLTNLIANAIRYSYDDSTIYLSIFEENGKIKFSVKDTGQGIAPQYKDKIFDRYYRVPGTKKEGTGLGLAISKEFIEVQGGHITVDTDFGAGSTFTVTLNGIDVV